MTVNRCCIFVMILLLSLLAAGLCFGYVIPEHMNDAAGAVGMKVCLKCHGESLHKPDRVHFGNYCMLGAQYPPSGREREFAAPAEIAGSGAMLEEGQVTCLSCHDLTKASPHVIRQGFKLCSVCHKTLMMFN